MDMNDLTGRLCKMKVPVQYGRISHYSRLCRIVKIEHASNDDYYVTIKIEKGEQGAGRRMRFFYTKAEMDVLEKNSWTDNRQGIKYERHLSNPQ